MCSQQCLHSNMDRVLSKEESYSERRELFKDIWQTAGGIEGEAAETAPKAKIIRTLRLAEVKKCADKRKKQRIRNLRTVCNKILDFCDRQDADDTFYKQFISECSPNHRGKVKRKMKKKRTHRYKENAATTDGCESTDPELEPQSPGLVETLNHNVTKHVNQGKPFNKDLSNITTKALKEKSKPSTLALTKTVGVLIEDTGRLQNDARRIPIKRNKLIKTHKPSPGASCNMFTNAKP